MKSKKILSTCLAFVLGSSMFATVACNNHDHNYIKWGKNDTQHWRFCPDDNAIDESTRASHIFGADGKCICGVEKPFTTEPIFCAFVYEGVVFQLDSNGDGFAELPDSSKVYFHYEIYENGTIEISDGGQAIGGGIIVGHALSFTAHAACELSVHIDMYKVTLQYVDEQKQDETWFVGVGTPISMLGEAVGDDYTIKIDGEELTEQNADMTMPAKDIVVQLCAKS
ncbi:MAG: hypothetical protein J1F69_03330 [Clostridiales bacterium]|nr:hypothetical protein [Clostridiales bacterium]